MKTITEQIDIEELNDTIEEIRNHVAREYVLMRERIIEDIEELCAELRNDECTVDAFTYHINQTINGEIEDTNPDWMEHPYETLTIGLTFDSSGTVVDYDYQTGDNSFTGPAYQHEHWAVADIAYNSEVHDVVCDLCEEIQERRAEYLDSVAVPDND